MPNTTELQTIEEIFSRAYDSVDIRLEELRNDGINLRQMDSSMSRIHAFLANSQRYPHRVLGTEGLEYVVDLNGDRRSETATATVELLLLSCKPVTLKEYTITVRNPYYVPKM